MDEKEKKDTLVLALVSSRIHPHGLKRENLINCLDFLHDTRGLRAIVIRSVESAPDHDALEWGDGAGVPVLMIPENWRNGPNAPTRQAQRVAAWKVNSAMHWCEEPFDRGNTALMEELARLNIKVWKPEARVYEKVWASREKGNHDAPMPAEPPKEKVSGGWDD